MYSKELGKTTLKPRGILDHEVGPTSLPGSYYSYSYARERGARQPDRATPAPPQGQLVFFRNNPHPVRVKHFKGLCDAPICMVQDARTEGHRVLMSAPSGDQRLKQPPARVSSGPTTRYGANTSKMTPAVGAVPVTYAWKDELENMAKGIVDKAASNELDKEDTLRMVYGEVDEYKILAMLCRILQTDSIPTVQEWLKGASETEKGIVLNMIRMAATGEVRIGDLRANPQMTASGSSRKNYKEECIDDDDRDEAHLARVGLRPQVKLGSSRVRSRHTLPGAMPVGELRQRSQPGMIRTAMDERAYLDSSHARGLSLPVVNMDGQLSMLPTINNGLSRKQQRSRQKIVDAPRNGHSVPKAQQVAGGHLSVSNHSANRKSKRHEDEARKRAQEAKAKAQKVGRIAYPEYWTPQ
eukprot:scpid64847/ scgid32081/ 